MNFAVFRSKIDDLILQAEYDKAISEVNGVMDEIDKNGDYYKYLLLKVEIYGKRSLYEQAVDLLEQEVHRDEELNARIKVKLYLEMVAMLYRLNELAKGLFVTSEIEAILENDNEFHQDKQAYHHYSIRLNSLKGRIYLNTDDLDATTLYLNRANSHLKTVEELYADSINEELGISLKKEKSIIANSYGVVHFFKGDLIKALEYYQEAHILKTELGDELEIAITLNNIGYTYYVMGTHDLSIDYLDKALKITDKYQNYYLTATTLFNLLRNYLDLDDKEHLQHILQRFDKIVTINENSRNTRIMSAYKLAQALVLLASKNLSKKFQAEEILRDLVSGNYEVQFAIIALVHLSEIYLLEAKLANDREILVKIKNLIMSLVIIAQKQKSEKLRIHVDMLMGKYEMIVGNYQEAEKRFNQALDVAQSMGISMLEDSIKQQINHLRSEFARMTKIVLKNQSIADAIRNADVLSYLEDVKKVI